MASDNSDMAREITKDFPLFSLNECKNRWGKVREEMSNQQLDCLLVFNNTGGFGTSGANLRYLTQIAHGFHCVFPLDGRPVVFGTLAHSVPIWRSTTNWDINLVPHRGAKGIASTITDMGYSKGKIGVVGFGRSAGGHVPETVPYTLFDGIKKQLPEAKFLDASDLLDGLRMIKSEEELDFLQKACELGSKMFDAIVETARPGVKECEVVAKMVEAEIANGGEISMIMLDSGFPPLIHARGTNPPTSTRTLQRGDIIITEYHASYAGYMAAVEHSFSLGEPPAEYRKIHDVCEQVYSSGTAAMTPGTPLSEVGKAFLEPIKKSGMNYIECGIHGHGLSSPDYPALIFAGLPVYKDGRATGDTEELFEREETSMRGAGSVILEENTVFGTNIDVFNPRYNNKSSLMLGDTVAVTKDKARKMTRIPLEFTVV